MSIEWVIITILSVIILVLLYILFNLYTKVSKLIDECDTLYDRSRSFYVFIINIMITTLDRLRQIDLRGAFESDDEVGFTFKTIVEIIEQTKHQLEKIESEG